MRYAVYGPKWIEMAFPFNSECALSSREKRERNAVGEPTNTTIKGTVLETRKIIFIWI